MAFNGVSGRGVSGSSRVASEAFTGSQMSFLRVSEAFRGVSRRLKAFQEMAEAF